MNTVASLEVQFETTEECNTQAYVAYQMAEW